MRFSLPVLDLTRSRQPTWSPIRGQDACDLLLSEGRHGHSLNANFRAFVAYFLAIIGWDLVKTGCNRTAKKSSGLGSVLDVGMGCLGWWHGRNQRCETISFFQNSGHASYYPSSIRTRDINHRCETDSMFLSIISAFFIPVADAKSFTYLLDNSLLYPLKNGLITIFLRS